MANTILLAQAEFADGGGGAGMAIFWILYAGVIILSIAAVWRVLEKAGQPGWAALIPIYNFIVLLRVAGRPWWWILPMLIPFVNIILIFIVAIDIAQNFGKRTGFGVGLALLPVIFYPILAWGSATYQPRS